MTKGELEETRRSWNLLADDWRTQVGDDGDMNRILNSDPVLWQFAGDVTGLSVLDAGCGTGYLSKKLHDKGARVVGVDLSDRMIEIAKAHYPELEFHVDSCSVLSSITDSSCDLVMSNYVLMDTPDLWGTLQAFSRVLKKGGVAVVVFSHPCFPQGAAIADNNEICYCWNFPYFQESKQIDPPWAHFQSDFIWFHRPLSDYWKAFTGAGFNVVGFEEPRVTEDRYHLTNDQRRLRNSMTRPYSVAFKLVKA